MKKVIKISDYQRPQWCDGMHNSSQYKFSDKSENLLYKDSKIAIKEELSRRIAMDKMEEVFKALRGEV